MTAMDPNRLDARRVALVLGRLRVGAGLALLVAPRLVGRMWMGDNARPHGARPFLRATGLRDLVLGVGTVLAVKDRSNPEHWLGMSAITDAGDALITLLARDVPRRARLTVVPGVLALAALDLKLSQQLADEAAAEELAIEEEALEHTGV